MKSSKFNATVHAANETICKKKMVKGSTGWLVKTALFSSLMIGLLAVTTTANASEWIANTANQIEQRINQDSVSLTFASGDTFYVLADVLNIKFDKLMELNGFKAGSQYTVPVGTVISFDGNKVTVKDEAGQTVSQTTLTNEDKVDQSQTFAGQVTDTPTQTTSTPNTTENTATTTPIVNETPAAHTETPVVETPAKKPSIPSQPIEPETPAEDNSAKISELTAQLAELNAQKDATSATLTDLQNQLNEAINANAAAEGAIKEAQSQLDAQNNLVAEKQNQIDSLTAAQNEAQSQLDAEIAKGDEADQIVIDQLNADIASKQAQLNAAQDQINDAQATAKELQAQLDAAQANLTDATELENQIAQTEAELNDLFNQIDAVEAELEALQGPSAEQTALRVARENALATLKQMNLREDLQTFVDQVNAARSVETINETVANAQVIADYFDAEDAAAKAAQNLANAKTEATATINSLNLRGNEQTYLDQVNTAETVEAVQAILADAQAEATVNDKEDEADKILADAKTAAVTEIAALNLHGNEQSFIDQVNAAATVEAIQTIVADAKTISEANDVEDEAMKDLESAKTHAKTQINEMNLRGTEATYLTQVDAATTIDQVKSILAEAQIVSDANSAEDFEIKELADAKTAALTKIAGMNLKTLASQFEGLINFAQTVEAIQAIVADAQKVSDEHDAQDVTEKELNDARKVAINGLSSMELTATQITTFTAQINSAQTIVAINVVVSDAKKAETENISNRELAAHKATALATIETLNLKSEKTSFVNQINAATTAAQINTIVAQAKLVSEQNDVMAMIDEANDLFLTYINEYRTSLGLGTLASNQILNDASDIRSVELETLFKHDRPNGKGYQSAVTEAAGHAWIKDFDFIGETIYSGLAFTNNAAEMAWQIFNRWKGSAGHNAVMTNKDYTSVGFQIYFNDGQIYVAALYAN